MSVNRVILIGNLGKDPEVKTVNGRKLATFSMATTESFKNKNGEKQSQTDWHNIVLWGSAAEIAEKYLKKGNQVYLEGKIKNRSYEDKDKNKRYVTEIFGDSFRIIGGNNNQSNNSSSKPKTQNNTSSPKEMEPELEDSFEDDDLPF